MIVALQLEDLAVRFGGVHAVDGVTLSIAPGEFVGLIGPNGAGKTTLIRIVSGSVRPDRGRVVLAGSDVTGNSTASRVRKGLALTHQMMRPFREMTVLDNVVLAAGYRRTATGEIVPRDIITSFTCRYNSAEIFRADLFPATAANPFITFTTVATESGKFEFEWIGDNGFSTTASASITVE